MPKKDKKKTVNSNWTKAGTYSTYEQADAKRKKIASAGGMQTKVRRRSSENNFTVHYRKSEAVDNKEAEKND